MKNITKEIRTKLGLSIKDFSIDAGFNNVQQVYSLEWGKAHLGLNLLKKMCDNLKASGHNVDFTLIVHVEDNDILID